MARCQPAKRRNTHIQFSFGFGQTEETLGDLVLVVARRRLLGLRALADDVLARRRAEVNLAVDGHLLRLLAFQANRADVGAVSWIREIR